MLYKNGKEITGVHHGQIAITAIYKGAILVWQAVRSCFDSGRWIGSKPWIGAERWKGTP